MLFRCSSIVLVVFAVACIAATANASTHVKRATMPIVKKEAHEDAARQLLKDMREKELFYERGESKKEYLDETAWDRIEQEATDYAKLQSLPSPTEFNAMKIAYDSKIATEAAETKQKYESKRAAILKDLEQNGTTTQDARIAQYQAAIDTNPHLRKETVKTLEFNLREWRSLREKELQGIKHVTAADQPMKPSTTTFQAFNPVVQIVQPMGPPATTVQAVNPSMKEGFNSAIADSEKANRRAKPVKEHNSKRFRSTRGEKIEPDAADNVNLSTNQKRENRRIEILKLRGQGATKLDKRIASLQAIVDIPGTLPPKSIAENKQKLEDLQKQRETELAAKR